MWSVIKPILLLSFELEETSLFLPVEFINSRNKWQIQFKQWNLISTVKIGEEDSFTRCHLIH